MKTLIPRNKFHQFKKLKNISINLRKNDTKAEQKFWNIVRTKRFNNLKFLRQKIIGEFIVDFYCHELKLVIELDGEIHKGLRERDTERNNYLKNNFGLNIIRIENKFILENTKEEIEAYLIKII
ncbi:MAG: hypothetical protein QG630_169 [Patescibacteria group bacterium]|nr:hypothetical protein [Patescibacteria group bacterium]